jgi:hypothetical protein
MHAGAPIRRPFRPRQLEGAADLLGRALQERGAGGTKCTVARGWGAARGGAAVCTHGAQDSRVYSYLVQAA